MPIESLKIKSSNMSKNCHYKQLIIPEEEKQSKVYTETG